ncbi:MAG: aldo/keto reductase [Planctomycetota bacterium]|nr:aldo/keto reductase [Planctomycetota bacterium]
MDVASKVKLNNGVEIPQLGLGVFRSPEGPETVNAVRWAIEAGYIHIDTAKIYGNEKSVGEGIRAGGLAREKLFLTTKLWNADMRANRQLAAFDESLKLLGVDYVDLYLIHWPVENYLDSWRTLEKIYASGKAKAVGVSNFQIRHLEKVLAETGVVPAVNQIELHPYLTQEPLRRFCAEKGIAVQAWSPIGGQGNDLLKNPLLADLGAKHGKTPAQIVIRWHLQRGVIAIPKSVKKERILENRLVFDFALSADEIAAVNGLNLNRRNGADPDNFNF